ncbi:MAG: GNAT family N-acetyltransferase [Chloroflexi bacterium]|nr:GNAT family N-acetyltransferase [Chloroflexota bacterium]
MTDANFATRPLTLNDASAYVDTVNAISEHIGIDDKIQAESALLEWREPGFDLGSCSIGVFDDSGGLLAGYATFWATGEPPVRPGLHWGVHPRYQSAKLEGQLLRWGQEQAEGVIARCPPDARISLWSGAHKGHTFAEAALERAGFRESRWYFDMEIELTERPAPPPFPAGISARPYCHEQDLPLLVDVVRDAFSDHFGYIEQPFEKDLELFRHWLDNDPYFDPALVIFPVAEDTGQVVGSLLGLTQDYRHPEAGYVDTVGVRRAYRRRGLATAMLQHSFAMFWDRGKRKVHLDVDGKSLTNAVALYERVGMYVYRRYAVYEKLLREGVELAKVSLE